MNRIVNFLQKYFAVISVLIGISILLSVTFSSYIVTSNNHKAAEMYIGELKYSIEIDGTTTNTLTVPAGETIIDVKVNNLNPVDTYYKLLYLNNSNLEIKYFSETKDTDEVKTNYKSPNDSVTSSNTNNLKLFIRNNSTTSQNVSFSLKGGYINNTLSDISVPSGYSEITTIEVPSSNTYFCKTDSTLTQGLEYVNGQYTYGYKKEGYYAPSRLAWSYISNNGWGVQLTDKASTDAVTSKLCTYINNKPVVSMSYMFLNSQAKALDLSNFDTSKVNNMLGMFWSSQATTLDISNFDTSNVTSMGSMFHISQATILDVSGFNTSKVTNMYNMFASSKAVTLDLSSFDTSNVTNMGYMFNNANNLKTIYVSSKFNIDTVTSSTNMFYGCTSLVGGSGTKYNSNYIDKTYARIDGGTSNPGYFTDIADKDIPAPNSFAADSWKTIIKAVRNNNISKYNVGDTRTIDMGTYGTHTLRIANKSKPSSCSKSGYSQTACGFVLEFADIITTYNMNPAGTYKNVEYEYGWNKDGWPASAMRTFVNNDIYNSLPSDLRSGIVETTVVSGYGSSDSANFTSTDKLYLLSPMEVWGDWTGMYGSEVDRAKNQTRQLDYYSNLGVTYNNYNSAIKKHGKTQYFWWHRSAKYDNNIGFYGMRGNGYAYRDGGVSPAFRIG